MPATDPNAAEVSVFITSTDADGTEVRIAEQTFSLSGGDLIAGEWVDLELCGLVDVDSPLVGTAISVAISGQYVHTDNWRLTVGNHPCDGCYQGNPATDLSGPAGEPDCLVDLYDYAFFAAGWLDCNLYPDCMTGW